MKQFMAALSDEDAAEVVAAMKEVAILGLRAARHRSGDIYEVRAEREDQSFRILFAPEGARGQVLLALEGFSKKDAEDAAGEDPIGTEATGGLASARYGVSTVLYRTCDIRNEMRD
ncbi:MAG: type II toxin-antitoxin system RelE/ParE family toxin [Acidimicrobiales bacterium]